MDSSEFDLAFPTSPESVPSVGDVAVSELMDGEIILSMPEGTETVKEADSEKLNIITMSQKVEDENGSVEIVENTNVDSTVSDSETAKESFHDDALWSDFAKKEQTAKDFDHFDILQVQNDEPIDGIIGSHSDLTTEASNNENISNLLGETDSSIAHPILADNITTEPGTGDKSEIFSMEDDVGHQAVDSPLKSYNQICDTDNTVDTIHNGIIEGTDCMSSSIESKDNVGIDIDIVGAASNSGSSNGSTEETFVSVIRADIPESNSNSAVVPFDDTESVTVLGDSPVIVVAPADATTSNNDAHDSAVYVDVFADVGVDEEKEKENENELFSSPEEVLIDHSSIENAAMVVDVVSGDNSNSTTEDDIADEPLVLSFDVKVDSLLDNVENSEPPAIEVTEVIESAAESHFGSIAEAEPSVVESVVPVETEEAAAAVDISTAFDDLFSTGENQIQNHNLLGSNTNISNTSMNITDDEDIWSDCQPVKDVYSPEMKEIADQPSFIEPEVITENDTQIEPVESETFVLSPNDFLADTSAKPNDSADASTTELNNVSVAQDASPTVEVDVHSGSNSIMKKHITDDDDIWGTCSPAVEVKPESDFMAFSDTTINAEQSIQDEDNWGDFDVVTPTAAVIPAAAEKEFIDDRDDMFGDEIDIAAATVNSASINFDVASPALFGMLDTTPISENEGTSGPNNNNNLIVNNDEDIWGECSPVVPEPTTTSLNPVWPAPDVVDIVGVFSDLDGVDDTVVKQDDVLVATAPEHTVPAVVDEDNWGDFGESACSPVQEPICVDQSTTDQLPFEVPSSSNVVSSILDDDDWEFEGVVASTATEIKPVTIEDSIAGTVEQQPLEANAIPNGDDDWGDFGDTTCSSPQVNDFNQEIVVPQIPKATHDFADDDWGDFGESAQAAASHAAPALDVTENPDTIASSEAVPADDDWGDFGDATPVVVSGVQGEAVASVNEVNDDDWGDFGEATTVPASVPSDAFNTATTITAAGVDDDWGDFDGADAAATATPATGVVASESSQAANNDDDEWGDFDEPSAAPAVPTAPVKFANPAAQTDSFSSHSKGPAVLSNNKKLADFQLACRGLFCPVIERTPVIRSITELTQAEMDACANIEMLRLPEQPGLHIGVTQKSFDVLLAGLEASLPADALNVNQLIPTGTFDDILPSELPFGNAVSPATTFSAPKGVSKTTPTSFFPSASPRGGGTGGFKSAESSSATPKESANSSAPSSSSFISGEAGDDEFLSSLPRISTASTGTTATVSSSMSSRFFSSSSSSPRGSAKSSFNFGMSSTPPSANTPATPPSPTPRSTVPASVSTAPTPAPASTSAVAASSTGDTKSTTNKNRSEVVSVSQTSLSTEKSSDAVALFLSQLPDYSYLFVPGKGELPFTE